MQTWLTFTKKDNMRLISHLDMIRLFRKAFRRAKIDLLYTEGFNPQQRFAVTNPLPLGFESLDEKMAIETESPFTEEKMNRLNEELPRGVAILSFCEPAEKTDLHSKFPFSIFAIQGLSQENINDILSEIVAMKQEDEVIWEKEKIKKGKKKIQKKSLLPLIGEVKQEGDELHLVLGAFDKYTLRPDDLMTYLSDVRKVHLPEYLKYVRVLQLEEK